MCEELFQARDSHHGIACTFHHAQMALLAFSADSMGRDACSSRQQGTLFLEARVQEVRGFSSGVTLNQESLHVREEGVVTLILSDRAFGIRLDPLRTLLMLVLEVGYFRNRLLSRDFTRTIYRSKNSLLRHLARGNPLVGW